MKKNDIITEFAQRANITKKFAKEYIDILGDVIVDGMRDDEGVTPFYGIKFMTVYKDAHEARNPASGDLITVPGKFQPKVKFGKAVKEAINA